MNKIQTILHQALINKQSICIHYDAIGHIVKLRYDKLTEFEIHEGSLWKGGSYVILNQDKIYSKRIINVELIQFNK
jgi:hypothetical protein